MKEVIFILLAGIAVGCGDGNRRTNVKDGTQTEDSYSKEALDSDTTRVLIDTTAAHEINRQ